MRALTAIGIGVLLLFEASPAWAVLQIWEGGTLGLAAPVRGQALKVEQVRIQLNGVGLEKIRQGETWRGRVRLRLAPPEKPGTLAVAIPYQLRTASMTINFPEPIDEGKPLAQGFRGSWQGAPLEFSTVPVKPTWGLPAQGFTFGWGSEWRVSEPGWFEYEVTLGVTTHESGARWARFALGPLAQWTEVQRLEIEVSPGVRAFRTCRQLMADSLEVYPYLAGHLDQPAGMRVGSQSVQWTLSQPSQVPDLDFCFVTAEAHRNNLLKRLILRPSAFFQGQEAPDLKKLRHLVYAVHGRKFRDKKLKKYFQSQWWYVPDPAFRFSRLSEGEKDLVRYLAKMERFAKK